MDASAAISQAIWDRRCLRFNYRNYSRLVEPYAVGTDGGGADVLCAYQLSGGDEEHIGFGWKFFIVADMRGVTVIDGHFDGTRTMPDELKQRLSAVAPRVRIEPKPAS